MRQIDWMINETICRQCSRCIAAEVCTVRAILRIDPDDAPYLVVNRCFDCRLCIPACPFNAISMRSSQQPPK